MNNAVQMLVALTILSGAHTLCASFQSATQDSTQPSQAALAHALFEQRQKELTAQSTQEKIKKENASAQEKISKNSLVQEDPDSSMMEVTTDFFASGDLDDSK